MEKGDRIELVFTGDEHTRLAPGDRGTITRISDQFGNLVVDVRWDGGSTLSLLPACGDRFRIVEGE